MEKIINEILALSQGCDCGNNHVQIPIERIVVDNGALGEAVYYVKEKSYKHAVLVADENTFNVAGKRLALLFKEAKIDYTLCIISPDENNDVVADEASLVQLLVETPREADVIIAVGSGTIHDIARFCGSKTGIPFISIPTAPSVDGFTSMGAPLIVRGVKKTFQTASPIAVFADLAVLTHAPKKMVAAGFGDMIAKCTSLVDWKFGQLVGGEPYCPLTAKITKEALDSCIDNVDLIAVGNEEGIRVLIEALIKSGLAMLLFGQSHPASGGEHHLSHFWEMEFLRQKKSQVLHGAKVGVSTPLLANLYRTKCLSILEGNLNEMDQIESVSNLEVITKIKENMEEIIAIIKILPDSLQLRELVRKVGGATMPQQLGIDDELVNRSLHEAHHLRDRFTLLKFLNECVGSERSIS
ncbi:sn-glycerol-1-phosphate dehydrogenase [Priestia megaterium]|uniref:sn-glycerol-1-phosphate dehydrogenase n=1 Tax=Priestia megaterium TaxID=1404 RepID=A0A6H1PA20_PRIMG|nr:sn-glycerol-1-phosphate dehydrogenase [Priestia megaterium]QIZ10315.1 sn-glycerol-1-phosphate dehydrogenase [Priestia megaterium]